MSQTIQWNSPDGVYTFELLTFETYNADTVYRRVINGYGDTETLKSLDVDDWKRLSSFATCLGHTKSISINLPENPSKAQLAFVEWWERNNQHRKRDYAKIYDDFGDSSPPELYKLWVAAYNETREDVPAAPPELAPGTLEQAQTDGDFLAAETPSSTG
jgi:hypothetical protein